VSNAAFLTVTGGAAATGNGTVTYSVAPNTGAPNVQTSARGGSITIAGLTFLVTQTGCTFSTEPVAATLSSGGGFGAVAVTTPSGCSWTVTGPPPWASTTSGGSGTGSGTWQYNVSPNSTGVIRSHAARIAALAPNFTLTQLALKPLVVDDDGQGSEASCDDATPAHVTVSAGISAATPGETVLVCPGTYVENVNFGGKAIAVRSASGPTVTVIDGNAADSVVTFSIQRKSGINSRRLHGPQWPIHL
jgi:hypothetical protein